MFDFRRTTLFCLGYRLSRHKMTICSKDLGGPWLTSLPWLLLWILVTKVNETSDLLLSGGFRSNGQLHSYIGITVHFNSNYKLHNAKLTCRRSKSPHTAENIVTQFEEIVNSFEITSKRLFSVAGWVFKSDRCCLTDKRFETLMFINCNKHFKHWLFLFNQYLKCLVILDCTNISNN